MANLSPNSSGNLELSGEYLAAMKTVSAHLMSRLPDGEALWQILGQTETLLAQAQLTGTPPSALFGEGGIAGFCQSIVDEQLKEQKGRAIPATVSSSRTEKKKKTSDKHVKRKKNLVTAAILTGWLLVVSLLLGWYTGLLSYFFHPYDSYLAELHNFTSQTTVLSGTEASVTLSLTSGAVQQQELYRSGEDYVTLTYVGYDEDELPAEKGGLRRYWIELSYPRHTAFSEITYVSPAESGTSTVVLPSGETQTQSIYWKSDGCNEQGIAYLRLYVLALPKDTPSDGLTCILSLDPMTQVHWSRNAVGPRSD